LPWGGEEGLYRHTEGKCVPLRGILRSEECTANTPMSRLERYVGYCNACHTASRTGSMQQKINRQRAHRPPPSQSTTVATRPFSHPSSRTPLRFLSTQGQRVRQSGTCFTEEVVRRLTGEMTTVHDNLRTALSVQQTSFEDKLAVQEASCREIAAQLAQWWTPTGVHPAIFRAIRDGAFEEYPALGTLVADAIKNHKATTGARHDDAFHNVFVAFCDQGGVRRALDAARFLQVSVSKSTVRRQARVVPSVFGLSWQSVRSAVVATLHQRDPDCVLAAHVAGLSADQIDEADCWKLLGPSTRNSSFAPRVIPLLGITDETKLRRSLMRVKNTGLFYSTFSLKLCTQHSCSSASTLCQFH
jgi:hypothetical protein